VESLGLSERLSFIPGDFFEQPLPATDGVLMDHILHDWDLPTKRMLIRNAFGLLMSLNMLIEPPGGFDHTGADCMGRMREAGFSSTRV
jgi:hypothetical protein